MQTMRAFLVSSASRAANDLPEMQNSLLEQAAAKERGQVNMARGDGRIFKRPNTSALWCEYWLRGKQFRESTGTEDPKKAAKFLRNRLNEVGADKIGAKPFAGPQQERVTVNEILDDLVAHYRRGGKRGIAREVNPQMRSHLKRLRDYFGESRALNVGSRDVEAFVAHQKAAGKANATINRSLQLLAQAFAYASNATPPKLSRALKIEMLDESGNVRKGKFSPAEAEAIFASLPEYLSDAARFAYETGTRAGELLKVKLSYLRPESIEVPSRDAKNRQARSIAITPAMQEILDRRRTAAVEGCDLIFHHNGKPIVDYRKAWQSACVLNGLGKFYCRVCKNAEGEFDSVLDATRTCSRCARKWETPRYEGRLFHDFRRSAAHEMWKAGSTADDCMTVTGHLSQSMFKRYADLFSDEEKRARQQQVQQRRREWREAQSASASPLPKNSVQ